MFKYYTFPLTDFLAVSSNQMYLYFGCHVTSYQPDFYLASSSLNLLRLHTIVQKPTNLPICHTSLQMSDSRRTI